MITALRTAFCTWTPWEEKITAAVIGRLGLKAREIIQEQLAAVNKVQRIVGWREVDLYVTKKGKIDWSGLPLLWDDREFVLATVRTKAGADRFETKVCCVGGHIFSFESDRAVRPFAFRHDSTCEVIEFDRRFL